MKSLMRVKIAVMLIAVATAFGSCKKGDTGPAGVNGINGTDGNANVHSQSFIVSSGLWIHTGTAGQSGDGYKRTVVCTIITPDIVNTGSVQVFLSDDNVSWDALPFTVPLGTSSAHYSESFLYEFKANEISFFIADTDFLTQPPSFTYYYKVVAISGSARMLHPNTNWNNYNEVKQALNLKD